MECRTCFESLTAYLDDELSTGEKSEIEGHLQACLTCRNELQSLRESFQVIETLSELELLPSLWHEIEAAIAAQPLLKHSWLEESLAYLRIRWVPITAFAGLVAVALSVGYLSIPDSRQALIAESLSEYVERREKESIEAVNVFRRLREQSVVVSSRNPFARINFASDRVPGSQE